MEIISITERRSYDGKRCTGLGDVSAGANMYWNFGEGKYDSRCSCCYLNISHTIDYHNQNMKGGEKWRTIQIALARRDLSKPFAERVRAIATF